ncbi:Tat pathway signal sequence domain protein, partial [Catenibacterium mitsuokai DSM 15897]
MKRRDFLRNSIVTALGGAGLYSALGNLRLVEAAARAYGPASFGDYKALVCVFLFGGNDSLNMLVPRDDAHYRQYAQARATLAVPQGVVAAAQRAARRRRVRRRRLRPADVHQRGR